MMGFKAAISLVAFGALVSPEFAQKSQEATLVVAVVLRTATVTITCANDVMKATTTMAATTSERGIAVFEKLHAGTCRIEGSLPLFETAVSKNVSIRSGENKQALVLLPTKLAETVTVNAVKRIEVADRAFINIITQVGVGPVR